MKKYAFPLIMWLLFEAIAITLWLALDNLFYLFNFSYIGLCLAFGIAFYIKKVKYARHMVQLAVGLYMLVYLGILSRENMQIEGFWYYLFLGVFEAAVIHYSIAKIFGPLLFGRGWCGYACWDGEGFGSASLQGSAPTRKNIAFIRYIVFALSLLFDRRVFHFFSAA